MSDISSIKGNNNNNNSNISIPLPGQILRTNSANHLAPPQLAKSNQSLFRIGQTSGKGRSTGQQGIGRGSERGFLQQQQQKEGGQGLIGNLDDKQQYEDELELSMQALDLGLVVSHDIINSNNNNNELLSQELSLELLGQSKQNVKINGSDDEEGKSDGNPNSSSNDKTNKKSYFIKDILLDPSDTPTNYGPNQPSQSLQQNNKFNKINTNLGSDKSINKNANTFNNINNNNLANRNNLQNDIRSSTSSTNLQSILLKNRKFPISNVETINVPRIFNQGDSPGKRINTGQLSIITTPIPSAKMITISQQDRLGQSPGGLLIASPKLKSHNSLYNPPNSATQQLSMMSPQAQNHHMNSMLNSISSPLAVLPIQSIINQQGDHNIANIPIRSYNNSNNNNNGSSAGKSSLFHPKQPLVRGNSNPNVPAEESYSNIPKLIRHQTSVVKNIKTEHDEDDEAEDSNVTGMFAMTRSCKVDFDNYSNNNFNSNNTYARRTSILKNSLKTITTNGKNANNSNNNNNENINNNGIHFPQLFPQRQLTFQRTLQEEQEQEEDEEEVNGQITGSSNSMINSRKLINGGIVLFNQFTQQIQQEKDKEQQGQQQQQQQQLSYQLQQQGLSSGRLSYSMSNHNKLSSQAIPKSEQSQLKQQNQQQQQQSSVMVTPFNFTPTKQQQQLSQQPVIAPGSEQKDRRNLIFQQSNYFDNNSKQQQMVRRFQEDKQADKNDQKRMFKQLSNKQKQGAQQVMQLQQQQQQYRSQTDPNDDNDDNINDNSFLKTLDPKQRETIIFMLRDQQQQQHQHNQYNNSHQRTKSNFTGLVSSSSQSQSQLGWYEQLCLKGENVKDRLRSQNKLVNHMIQRRSKFIADQTRIIEAITKQKKLLQNQQSSEQDAKFESEIIYEVELLKDLIEDLEDLFKEAADLQAVFKISIRKNSGKGRRNGKEEEGIMQQDKEESVKKSDIDNNRQESISIQNINTEGSQQSSSRESVKAQQIQFSFSGSERKSQRQQIFSQSRVGSINPPRLSVDPNSKILLQSVPRVSERPQESITGMSKSNRKIFLPNQISSKSIHNIPSEYLTPKQSQESYGTVTHHIEDQIISVTDIDNQSTAESTTNRMFDFDSESLQVYSGFCEKLREIDSCIIEYKKYLKLDQDSEKFGVRTQNLMRVIKECESHEITAAQRVNALNVYLQKDMGNRVIEISMQIQINLAVLGNIQDSADRVNKLLYIARDTLKAVNKRIVDYQQKIQGLSLEDKSIVKGIQKEVIQELEGLKVIKRETQEELQDNQSQYFLKLKLKIAHKIFRLVTAAKSSLQQMEKIIQEISGEIYDAVEKKAEIVKKVKMLITKVKKRNDGFTESINNAIFNQQMSNGGGIDY